MNGLNALNTLFRGIENGIIQVALLEDNSRGRDICFDLVLKMSERLLGWLIGEWPDTWRCHGSLLLQHGSLFSRFLSVGNPEVRYPRGTCGKGVVKTEDGRSIDTGNGWSSRSGRINGVFGEKLQCVLISTDDGYSFGKYHVSRDTVQAILETAGLNKHRVEDHPVYSFEWDRYEESGYSLHPIWSDRTTEPTFTIRYRP